MSSILSAYTVMQQSEWAGRRFYTARDRRSGQIVYLVAEPAEGPLEPYRQSGLPRLEPITLEGETRWLVAELPSGDTLEDLRAAGRLTEADIAAALLSACDALGALAALSPPPVPSYLDPACIKRDAVGRWTLDFLALAQATEARGTVSPPPGVHAMGVLLFWLVTGQTVRRSRVQFDRAEHQMSPALQFILIRCLGKVYPSLAELRTDLERASREREFRALVPKPGVPGAHQPPEESKPMPSEEAEVQPRPAGVEFHRVPLGGPNIPLNDRPWALPPRPADGFRRYVVPPPPDVKTVRRNRFIMAGMAGAVAVSVAGGVAAWQTGLLPTLPGPSTTPAPPASSPLPEIVQPSPVPGPEVPPVPEPPKSTVAESPAPAERDPSRDPFTTGAAKPAAEPQPSTAQPAPATPARPVPSTPKPVQPQPKPAPVQPAPVQKPPDTTQTPPRPILVPGSPDELDASQGGLPTLVHLNGRTPEWAYLIPHPTSPYITLPTFNRLFGQELYWAPHDGNTVRVYSGSTSIVTGDFTVVRSRLWLKLTPPLQQILGVQVQAYTSEGIFFTVS